MNRLKRWRGIATRYEKGWIQPSRNPSLLRGVPVLVADDLLANLEAQTLHSLKRLA